MSVAPTKAPLPHTSELHSAFEQIRRFVRSTPLLKSDALSQLINGEVWVKAESLQITGAFKFRGALYRLLNLDESEKKQGVIAYSSGNFAAGLAAAAHLLDVPATLVMPHDAPYAKVHNARKYGARVILCKHMTPSREEAASTMARTMAQSDGLTLLHPFDDRQLIIGQASVALDLLEQLQSIEQSCDHVLCPTGGGSLVAGTRLAMPEASHVWAIEIKGYQGMNLSIERGARTRAKGDCQSDCDALMALEPGFENLSIIARSEVQGMVVPDSAVHQAILLAFQDLNLVLEPSGAVGIAALLEQPRRFAGQSVVVIASGGNINAEKYSKILTMTPERYLEAPYLEST